MQLNRLRLRKSSRKLRQTLTNYLEWLVREISGYDKAMGYALYLLGVRMRTVMDIRTRLDKKGYSAEVTQQVLLRLKELGYLDDSAYIEAYVKTRQRATGSRRLKYELVQKGVAQDLLDEGLEVIYPPDQETAVAVDLAEKLWHRVSSNIPRGWQKLTAQEIHLRKLRKITTKLLSRGFSYSTVNEVMQKLKLEFTETDSF